ncbi:hypothetical protein SLS56_011730 [Neofusicoccum ribis]|uniref:Ubiquitin-like protease family profile domain-containing protein n=1 Tax=Neofusicoccum ribis TaxID=45134 RepID=A0ABR3SCA2_9PEZI
MASPEARLQQRLEDLSAQATIGARDVVARLEQVKADFSAHFSPADIDLQLPARLAALIAAQITPFAGSKRAARERRHLCKEWNIPAATLDRDFEHVKAEKFFRSLRTLASQLDYPTAIVLLDQAREERLQGQQIAKSWKGINRKRDRVPWDVRRAQEKSGRFANVSLEDDTDEHEDDSDQRSRSLGAATDPNVTHRRPKRHRSVSSDDPHTPARRAPWLRSRPATPISRPLPLPSAGSLSSAASLEIPRRHALDDDLDDDTFEGFGPAALLSDDSMLNPALDVASLHNGNLQLDPAGSPGGHETGSDLRPSEKKDHDSNAPPDGDKDVEGGDSRLADRNKSNESAKGNTKVNEGDDGIGGVPGNDKIKANEGSDDTGGFSGSKIKPNEGNDGTGSVPGNEKIEANESNDGIGGALGNGNIKASEGNDGTGCVSGNKIKPNEGNDDGGGLSGNKIKASESNDGTDCVTGNKIKPNDGNDGTAGVSGKDDHGGDEDDMDVRCLRQDAWIQGDIFNRLLDTLALLHPSWQFVDSLRVTSQIPTQQTLNTLRSTEIVFGLHLQDHWVLVTLVPTRREINVYDSLPSADHFYQACSAIQSFFTKLLPQETWTEWCASPRACPLQDNTHDCGVFGMLTACRLATGLPLPTHADGALWRLLFAGLFSRKPAADGHLGAYDDEHADDATWDFGATTLPLPLPPPADGSRVGPEELIGVAAAHVRHGRRVVAAARKAAHAALARLSQRVSRLADAQQTLAALQTRAEQALQGLPAGVRDMEARVQQRESVLADMQRVAPELAPAHADLAQSVKPLRAELRRLKAGEQRLGELVGRLGCLRPMVDARVEGGKARLGRLSQQMHELDG